MKESKKMRGILFVLVFAILFSVGTVFSVSAADVQFEKEIASFPESYKVQLRKLHEKYPSWQFEPFVTGLDWETVIEAEADDRSLVYDKDTARILKSLDADDYSPSNDYYYQKDGGFVAGSRLAVAYFMDPRNFLDEAGIFQFEVLSFNKKFTVDAVEAILEGTFMHKKTITYYDVEGKLQTMELTYGETIFRAGKENNINPCFLAAKIRNEIGTDGSDSVSGKVTGYPGIYNFYNIGASDGVGAILRGLEWASGYDGKYTSYSRPWTTPYKSIMGGAEFLAENYVDAGQFTGYLQRFNVNPDSYYDLYTHQYMTNLSGALSQGVSSYYSYEEMKLLDTPLVFSIPVYKNMSDEEGGGTLFSAESILQYGKINTQRSRVRKGPSTDHDYLTDNNRATVWLEKGTEVRIISKCRTDSYDASDILSYPYWYEVKFTYSGTSYTGFVPCVFVDVSTGVYVTKGAYDLPVVKSEGVTNGVFYSDPTMVKVVDDNTVRFLKDGSVSVYLYDSAGKMDEIRFNVGDYSSYYPKDLIVKQSGSSVDISIAMHEKATNYLFSIVNSKGKVVKKGTAEEGAISLKGLVSGEAYTVYAQYCFGKTGLSKAVSESLVIKPQKVENLKFTKNEDETVTLSWSPVENAEGYELRAYNTSTDKYEHVAYIPFGTESYALSFVQTALENFCVRAYCTYSGKTVYGPASELVSVSDRPEMPKNVKVSSATTKSYKLSWTGVECDAYEIYARPLSQSKYTLYKTTAETSVTVSGLEAASATYYKIRAVRNTESGKLRSFATSAVMAITKPATPTGLAVKPGSNRAVVSWNAVKGATAYRVYYKKSGDALKYVTAEGTKAEIKGLDGSVKYYFAVSAVVSKADVTAVGSKCKTASAVTKPSVPTGLTIKAIGADFVKIGWNKDKTLDRYKVYLLDSDGKTVSSKVLTENTVKLTSLKKGASYKIIVRGYKLVDGKYISSENSQALSVKPVDAKIKNLKAASVTASSAVISWDKVSSAAYYQVYLRKNGKNELISTVNGNQYTVENLGDCTSNYVTVRACFVGYLADYYGEKTTLQFYTRPLSVEKITVSERTDTSYKLTWDESSKAVNRYYIYRFNSTSKKFEQLAYTSKTAYTVKNLKPGSRDRYAVIASLVKDGKAVASSKHTYYCTAETYLSKVQNLRQTAATKTALRISWDAVEGASSYRIYLYDRESKKFTLVTKTATTVVTFKNLTSGTEYIYRVRAMKGTKTTPISGYVSASLYAKTK